MDGSSNFIKESASSMSTPLKGCRVGVDDRPPRSDVRRETAYEAIVSITSADALCECSHRRRRIATSPPVFARSGRTEGQCGVGPRDSARRRRRCAQARRSIAGHGVDEQDAESDERIEDIEDRKAREAAAWWTCQAVRQAQ